MSLLSKKKLGPSASEDGPRSLAVALSVRKAARKNVKGGFAAYQGEEANDEERPNSIAAAIRAKLKKPEPQVMHQEDDSIDLFEDAELPELPNDIEESDELPEPISGPSSLAAKIRAKMKAPVSE